MKGFTLIELVVSIAIFATISSLVVANFRAGARSDELRLAAERVSAAIRDAEARASAGTTSPICAAGERAGLQCPDGASDCPGSACIAQVPEGGYGIAASPAAKDRVFLFADENANGQFEDGEQVEEIRLAESGSVSVGAVVPDPMGSTISFLPPGGAALVNGGTAENTFTITIEHSVSGGTRVVTVNRISRLVEITAP